jgi:transposase InsO family protein
MKMILRERRVWKVVIGEETKPDSTSAIYESASETASLGQQTPYERDLTAFEEKLDRANAVLFATISPSIIADIQGIDDPSEVWKVLEQRYAPKTDMSKMTAWMNFINAKINDNELVPNYLLRLARYKIRCEECGSTVDNDKQPESQSKQSTDVAKYEWKPAFRSYSDPYHAQVTYFAASMKSASPNVWMFDSDCNSHITPFRDRIYDYHEFEEKETIYGFAKRPVSAIGEGSMDLVDEFGRHYTLDKVIYVPEAEHPLLSMMKLLRLGADLKFKGTNCTLTLEGGCLLQGSAVGDMLYLNDFGKSDIRSLAVTTRGKAKNTAEESREDDAMSIDETPPIQPIREQEIGLDKNITSATPSPPPKVLSPKHLWHDRLGHASASTLSKIPTIKSTFDSATCTSCIRAKQHRKPFRKSNYRATKKLQCIHSDLSGPHILSMEKSKYYLTFMDDLTRYKWVKMLPNKKSKHVFKAIEEWVQVVERQTGCKVQTFRTDGGKEYWGDLTPFLRKLGIEHQESPPYTPQSNGRSERLNRVINESARAMLIHANLPQQFWEEAVDTAAYTWNRLPNSAVDNKTPFEFYFDDIPDLSRMRPFGCVVYALIPKERRRKLSKFLSRSNRGIFVGYVSSTSWRYYDLERKCFDESHDLQFMETEFPGAEEFSHLPPIASQDEDAMFGEERQTVAPPSVAKSVPPVIHDMVVVEPPPAVQALAVQVQVQRNSEPTNFHDAVSRRDGSMWIEAMHSELQSLEDNNVWELCELPPGRNVIGTKWVFKVKVDGMNVVERYKARIVAQGFSQVAGLDFEETWAPVVRIESVRVLLAFAALTGFEIIHIDAKTAFLNGDSDVELYVRQPVGFVDKRNPNKVLRLNKSLYGLKQAPRIWYLLLCERICSLGFVQCTSDPSIYVHAEYKIILAVYVDDILVFGPSKTLCDEFYFEISKYFRMEYKGQVRSFLGLNVIRNGSSIAINQIGYIEHMLQRFQMTDAKPESTPLNHTLPLRKATPNDVRADIQTYQELTGSLNHAALFSRPDIAFAVSKLSQFNSDPTETHMRAARHVLAYLKGTIDYSIIYGDASDIEVHAYTRANCPRDQISTLGFADADHGTDKDDRKSQTGYVFMINNGPVSWTSHKQSSVALSTMEAEYMSLSDSSREAIARANLYCDLNIIAQTPLIYTDSTTALSLTDESAKYQRAKHIDIRYHYVRDVLQKGQIQVDYVPSEQNPADVFTKALPPPSHQHCVLGMGLRVLNSGDN